MGMIQKLDQVECVVVLTMRGVFELYREKNIA